MPSSHSRTLLSLPCVAEMALHDLGFSILVRRRFDNATGEPVRLTREQINNSSI